MQIADVRKRDFADCRDVIQNPKFIGVTREKTVQEQFENKIWLLFASMGVITMNADGEFYMSYDFHDESLV